MTNLKDLSRNKLAILSYTKLNDKPWQPEKWQLHLLTSTAKFQIYNKARQIGFSFICSALALANALTVPDSTTIFLSYNLQEAKEKIRYMNLLWESLPNKIRPRKSLNTSTEIEFAKLGRIISHPSKPTRGKAKATIILDEFAHCQHDQEIYQGTTACLIRDDQTSLIIGSTPLGQQGIFWEIYKHPARYPLYQRTKIPWWLSQPLSTNPKKAQQIAASLPTQKRVHTFGTQTLLYQFQALDLQSFQQEFECQFTDESTAYFPYSLLKNCENKNLILYTSIEQLARNLCPDEILYGGYDVGRSHDVSELIILAKNQNNLTCRLNITLPNCPYPTQEAVLTETITKLKLAKLFIDKNGIGNQLAEIMESKFPNICQGFNFTNHTKQLMTTEIKSLLEKNCLTLPPNPELQAQIHSIQKTYTNCGYTKFEGNSANHHADKFWALALATYAAKTNSFDYYYPVETETGLTIITSDNTLQW